MFIIKDDSYSLTLAPVKFFYTLCICEPGFCRQLYKWGHMGPREISQQLSPLAAFLEDLGLFLRNHVETHNFL